MNILYKRIVTLCMVSISTLLAWIYCIFSIKNNPILIVVMSLAFVASVYALLNAYLDVKARKDEQMKSLIDDAVNNTINKLNNDNKNLELERLLKASYVQVRKINSTLSAANDANDVTFKTLISELARNNQASIETFDDMIKKYATIIAKYNKKDADSIIKNITSYEKAFDNIAMQIAEVNMSVQALSSLEAAIDKALQLPAYQASQAPVDNIPSNMDIFENNASEEQPVDDINIANMLDEFIKPVEAYNDFTDKAPENTSDEVADKITDEVADAIAENTNIETSSSLDAITEAPDYDPNKQLSPEDIAALFAAATPQKEIKVEDTTEATIDNVTDEVTDKVADNTNNETSSSLDAITEAPDYDPNKQLSPEDIAALFAASKEANKANSIDDFEVFDHPDSMDQNLIDALLGLETSDEELEKLDDLDSNTVAAGVIPFPTKEINELEEQLLGSENSSLEVSSPNEDMAISEEFDPNKQLSQDEISSLFSSMSSIGKEPTIEEIDAFIGDTKDKEQTDELLGN